MTDLPERLRAYQQADADGVMVTVSRQACDEAADEIERLQSSLARHVDSVCALTTERDALRARIEGARTINLSRSDIGAWNLPDSWSGKRVALVVIE